MEFLVLLENVAERGVEGAFYHCTVGADGSLDDISDSGKMKAYEQFVVKEAFFPSAQTNRPQPETKKNERKR